MPHFPSFLKWFICVYVKFLSSKRVIKILRLPKNSLTILHTKWDHLGHMSRAWRGLLEHIPSSFQREYSASIHAGSSYITNFAKLFFFVWKSWECGLGWPWFAWAAQEFSDHRTGACCDITKLKSTHINPALASHAELKADIGLSV